MANWVDEMYVYEETTGKITVKARYVWEELMDCVNTSLGIELDSLYYSKNFTEMLGGTIPSSILTALVKRGLLHCDGKVDGLNAYSITTEIYDYYKNCYKPTKDAYKKRLKANGF
jgi:hypothetical protein